MSWENTRPVFMHSVLGILKGLPSDCLAQNIPIHPETKKRKRVSKRELNCERLKHKYII